MAAGDMRRRRRRRPRRRADKARRRGAGEERRSRPTGQSRQRAEERQSGSNPAIAVRTNFNPLAAFAPAVKTGADGSATVALKLPDNLTRYRIVAIAVAGDKQFGKGESPR
jgi:uncharacterized protein YfaS (alpha-2-macroglobulin family)